MKNLFSYVKMGQKVLTSGDIKIEKKNYRNKISIHLRDVDIKIVLVSNKFSSSEKSYK